MANTQIPVAVPAVIDAKNPHGPGRCSWHPEAVPRAVVTGSSSDISTPASAWIGMQHAHWRPIVAPRSRSA